MEVRVLLMAAGGGVFPLLLGRLLTRIGACGPRGAGFVAAAAPLGAALALRYALHGAWPGWPPHDAGEVSAWLVPALALGSLARSVVGWALPVLAWSWLATEPYRTVHWVGEAPILRALGIASAIVLAAAACRRGLGLEGSLAERDGDASEDQRTSSARLVLHEGMDLSVLGSALLGAAVLLGHSTGSGALTIGGLGLALGAIALDGWLPGTGLPGRARFEASIPVLVALAGAAFVQGILYASVPVGPALLLAASLGLLAIRLDQAPKRAIRSLLAVGLVMVAVTWGWPPPDPYAAGW